MDIKDIRDGNKEQTWEIRKRTKGRSQLLNFQLNINGTVISFYRFLSSIVC